MVDQTPQTNVTPPAGNPPQTQPVQSQQAAQIHGTPVTQQPQQAVQQPLPQRPKQTANIKKPTSKISMKGILIWCAVIFMFVIGWLVLVFYNLMNNPTQLASVWLDPNTTKSLLQSFAVLFFGFLTFLGIGFLIVNLYRIITVKNKWRLRYVFGAILGFVIFIFALVLWAKVLNIVKGVSVDSMLDSDKLIMPYLQLKDGPKHIRNTENLNLIAPGNMYFMLNKDYYLMRIVPWLWKITTEAVVLDCGNGQKLAMNLNTSQFNWACNYFKKGEYVLTVNIKYTNLLTSETLQKTFPWWSLFFESEINVKPIRSELMFNDTHTEMIFGKSPIKVEFDANTVFRDFGLREYLVIWDFDGDGKAEKQNVVNTTHIYNEAKVYNVFVRFPWLNNHIYTFPVRVEQSDVPVCEVVLTKWENNEYTIDTSFLEKNVKIREYQFSILDRDNKDEIVDTIKKTQGTLDYVFPTAGNYSIQVDFLTEEDKKGVCESEDVQVGVSDFQVNYTMYFKSPQSLKFQKIENEWIVYYEDDELIITEIPIILKLEVNKILPDSASITKKVLLDSKSVLSSNNNVFDFTINNSENHIITLLVENTTNETKTEIPIPVRVEREDLIGVLLIQPDMVGIDPFEVTFDASTTILNDPDDEIVGFSWNFGDWSEPKLNFSESIITHTYRYDTKNENGSFTPVLTIKTRKWRVIDVSPETAIIVKRSLKKLDIKVPSHPAQIAKVWDKVKFAIDFNGLPTNIIRKFWDEKTLSCKTRQECWNISNVYIAPGSYQVRVAVEYENQPTIEGTITIKVNP